MRLSDYFSFARVFISRRGDELLAYVIQKIKAALVFTSTTACPKANLSSFHQQWMAAEDEDDDFFWNATFVRQQCETKNEYVWNPKKLLRM